MNYTQFRTEVFSQIDKVIDSNNCSTFKIMGYKHLDIRLVLNFDDCHQVFDFILRDDKVEVESFYTKDFANHEEKLADIVSFKEESERDKPE